MEEKGIFGDAMDWLGTALGKVGGWLGDVTEFYTSLPGRLSEWADRLAEHQRQQSSGATRNALQFRLDQLFGDAGPLIILALIAVVFFMTRK